MEKKVIFVLVFMLVCVSANALPAGPAASTVTAADGVTITPVSWEDSLMQVRLQELHFDITPEFQFVLPDASLKIGLKQKLGDTMLDASTEYNYLYNKIRYDIRYSLDIYLIFAANLYDAVSFEQLYQDQKYIQRNKGFGLSVQSPEVFNFIVLREEFKTDNYYFARLDGVFVPSAGWIMKLDSWAEFDLNFNAAKLSAENRLAVNIEKSFPFELSEYNFLFLNIFLDKKFDFGGGQMFTVKFNGGYLLEKNVAPIWQIYRLGGFERMMGYNYDEFEGYYMDFFRMKYETPILEKLGWELPLVTVDTIRMFIIVDAGTAGGDHEVTNLDHYSYSAGLGFIVEMTFRKRTQIRMTFAVAQAMKQGRMPVFYFAHAF